MEQQAVEVRMGQTHLGFVDAAKGLGMLAIIWGHMDYLWSTSSVWFSSFKIAVFYVVVGLLKAYRYGERGQRDSCAQVMKKRWYSLVIPYGVFSALAILAHLAFLTIHGGSRLAALKGDVILTVTLRGVATLWFLPTLLIAELLFAAVRPEGWSAAKRILVCVLAPAILCVSGFWFMLCGYLLYRRGKPQRLGRLPVLAVLLAVNLGLSLLSPDLDFNSFKLGSFAPVFYLNGVLGSVAVLELLRWLEARISLRPLIWCGRHSMFLMATHLPWQIAPELVMLGKRFYLAQTPTAPYFLMMLAEFAVLMLIEAALVWCKEKVKAAMTGRWGKERPICKAVKYL